MELNSKNQSDNKNECTTCALLRDIKENGKYYASLRPEKKDKWVTVCKSVVVMEDYYKDGDKLEYGGRVAYNSRPMNFCSECGRRIDVEEITW